MHTATQVAEFRVSRGLRVPAKDWLFSSRRYSRACERDGAWSDHFCYGGSDHRNLGAAAEQTGTVARRSGGERDLLRSVHVSDLADGVEGTGIQNEVAPELPAGGDYGVGHGRVMDRGDPWNTAEGFSGRSGRGVEVEGVVCPERGTGPDPGKDRVTSRYGCRDRPGFVAPARFCGPRRA